MLLYVVLSGWGIDFNTLSICDFGCSVTGVGQTRGLGEVRIYTVGYNEQGRKGRIMN